MQEMLGDVFIRRHQLQLSSSGSSYGEPYTNFYILAGYHIQVSQAR